MTLVFLTAPQAIVLAQPLPSSTTNYQISPKELTINALEAKEIFLEQSGKAATSQDLDIPPVYNKAILRDITWEKQVPTNQLKLPLEIDLQLKSNNGADNQFAIETNSSAKLGAIIQQKENIVLPGSDANTSLVKGKVTLRFDPSQANIAGSYKGRLLVCVKGINNECI